MKKVLTGALILGALSTAAYGASRYIEVGTEVEDFTSSYEHKDFVMPYVAGKINPFDNSPFFIEGKFSYQQHDNDAEKAKNRRKRTELYTGYAWKFGDFAFTPKVGFRHNDYASSSTGDPSRENTHNSQMEYRIYPNMSYKINDNTSWFFSGFVAPVDSKLNDTKSRSGDSTRETGKEYSDYKHELDSGFQYRLPNGDRITASIYSEYSRQVYSSSTEEWQLRLKYRHQLENGKTTVEPFARIGLDRENRSKTGGVDRDTLRHRFGSTVDHKITDTFSIRGEVYYQTSRVENSSGVRESDENKMFYKLGFRQEF